MLLPSIYSHNHGVLKEKEKYNKVGHHNLNRKTNHRALNDTSHSW
jgi:hypothetical protein